MIKKYIPIALFTCLIMSCTGSRTATVAVSNESGWELRSLTVEVSDQEKTIKNLRNGESTTLTFQNLHDSHYTLNGKLSDGSMIHGEYGYASNGIELNDSFVIYAGGKLEFQPGPH